MNVSVLEACGKERLSEERDALDTAVNGTGNHTIEGLWEDAHKAVSGLLDRLERGFPADMDARIPEGTLKQMELLGLHLSHGTADVDQDVLDAVAVKLLLQLIEVPAVRAVVLERRRAFEESQGAKWLEESMSSAQL